MPALAIEAVIRSTMTSSTSYSLPKAATYGQHASICTDEIAAEGVAVST